MDTGMKGSDSTLKLAWFTLICILNMNVLYIPMLRELKHLFIKYPRVHKHEHMT